MAGASNNAAGQASNIMDVDRLEQWTNSQVQQPRRGTGRTHDDAPLNLDSMNVASGAPRGPRATVSHSRLTGKSSISEHEQQSKSIRKVQADISSGGRVLQCTTAIDQRPIPTKNHVWYVIPFFFSLECFSHSFPPFIPSLAKTIQDTTPNKRSLRRPSQRLL